VAAVFWKHPQFISSPDKHGAQPDIFLMLNKNNRMALANLKTSKEVCKLKPLPDRPNWTHYSGHFYSVKYGKVISRGSVYTQLPDVIDSKKPEQVQATIQYHGLYRTNAIETFPITLTDLKQSSTEFETKPTTVQGHQAPHGKGVLQFTVRERNGKCMKGTFKLSNPSDNGEFELYNDLQHFENKCLVM
jgi:hypothetical protein